VLARALLAQPFGNHEAALNALENALEVCCSVLQCVAVCCSVLQCVAVCCSVLGCVLQCVAAALLDFSHSPLAIAKPYSMPLKTLPTCVVVRVLQCVLQCVVLWLLRTVGAVCCSVLQCVAVCCCVLQCAAVCCAVALEDSRCSVL